MENQIEKERGFFCLLLHNKTEMTTSVEEIIAKSEESEELKKSEERLKKMIEKYKIENFESFGVAKKTPRIKKSRINQQDTIKKEELENGTYTEKQTEQKDLER